MNGAGPLSLEAYPREVVCWTKFADTINSTSGPNDSPRPLPPGDAIKSTG